MNESGFQQVVDALRDCNTSGGALPGAAYSDETLYRLEASTLYRDGWFGLACAQLVAAADDLFPVELCGLSLLIVRQKDLGVKVFYNLCRHRGARLVDQPCTARAGLMICPYHAWSYRVDGALAAAPEYARDGNNTQPSANDKMGLGLIEIPSRTWRDVIFISLAQEPLDFDEWIRPIDGNLAEWNPDELQPLGTREFAIGADWKLAAENFLDVYHLPIVHPQLGGGFHGAVVSEDIELAPHIIGVRMPIGYGSGSRTDACNSPCFSSLSERNRDSVEVFCIFPNTLILVEPDWQQVITLRPQGVGVVHQTFADYIVMGDQQLDEETRLGYFHDSAEVNVQDKHLLEGQQGSRSMPAGGLTVLSDTWDQTPRRFQQLWLMHMLSVLNG